MALIKKEGTATADIADSLPAPKPQYVDKNAEGQREGNRRNVAAILTQGVIMANGGKAKEALSIFWEIRDAIAAKDAEQ